ncbi:CoB--CoM heterodisulfide reductase 1 iron-sulfur subunit A [uncultured Desulfobacterium sp.]|uniref:CoB--CoM heterodisulfide reductase 1 iron-sulfur subunit A n=1 Tax=uncultured Desulfobacterium sp. TaxID=201089 RepID=A0A445N0Q2_9BACT|nr:CoB--CoM heterodisulfide reductase 1 iron-sulfur subunit A [uncultured Desulfobacterium sp.]
MEHPNTTDLSQKTKEKDDLRIGVYICHCGLNIGAVVDCERVAVYASGLSGVVLSRHNSYTCSEPGQNQLKKDIVEHSLNRVVVASCSPRLHEPTFKKCVTEAGLNPYLLEMANIREHCSWVHGHDKEGATKKACDLVRAAVARARLLEERHEAEVPVGRTTLVIGGGVAGIQASLDLADAGYKVILVEKRPSIGGVMAALDKTFPTMDCSICILGPKMTDVGRHPNITLLTFSEVREITGFVGNFHIRVLKRARYVMEKMCTACGDCAGVCPVVVPDEFDVGLSLRHAIYSPFPQAVPSSYLIDIEKCLGYNPVVCGKCVEKCEKKCIDFHMSDEELDFDVSTIIVATGMDMYDPAPLDEYGYTRFQNVLTSMEFERLINAGGPTKGDLIRMTDRKRPASVAFIQCVGSRSLRRGESYCSNVCCMNTIKCSFMLKEHYGDIEVKVFYVDIRAFGNGFEELYLRTRRMGVRYIRGLPGAITEDHETGDLLLSVENASTHMVETHRAEMVVLATGVRPPEDMNKVQEMLALQKNADGFYLDAHPKLMPVDSAIRGVFFAGCAEGPKDIKDSVTQASAAAGRAIRLMNPGSLKVEAITAEVDPEKCSSCGLCQKICPYNAISVDKRRKIPAVVTTAACSGCGACAAECPEGAIEMHHFTDKQIEAQIDAILEQDPGEIILIFACNWCSYAGADFAGVSRLQYPANTRLIRTMCSGRVSEGFIWRAFKKGSPVVLVSGCHIGDCHYINANHATERRMKRMWRKMENLGIRKERLQLEWISATEGIRFKNTMERMEHIRKSVTTDEITVTREILQ